MRALVDRDDGLEAALLQVVRHAVVEHHVGQVVVVGEIDALEALDALKVDVAVAAAVLGQRQGELLVERVRHVQVAPTRVIVLHVDERRSLGRVQDGVRLTEPSAPSEQHSYKECARARERERETTTYILDKIIVEDGARDVVAIGRADPQIHVVAVLIHDADVQESQRVQEHGRSWNHMLVGLAIIHRVEDALLLVGVEVLQSRVSECVRE